MCTTCWTGGLNHPLWFNWLAGTLATIVNTGTVDGHPTNSGSHIRGQTHWHVGPGVTTPCALNLGALWCAWMPDERQSWSKVTLAQSLLPKQRSNDCQIDTKLVAEARKLCQWITRVAVKLLYSSRMLEAWIIHCDSIDSLECMQWL